MELSAPVTTSIALHHFTAWARYEEVRVQLLTLIERKDEQACSGSDPTGLAKVKTRVFAGALCACQRAACLY